MLTYTVCRAVDTSLVVPPVFCLPMGERACWTDRVNAGMAYRNGILLQKKPETKLREPVVEIRSTYSLWEAVSTNHRVTDNKRR